jgi:Na+-driven multidrug efflux pump
MQILCITVLSLVAVTVAFRPSQRSLVRSSAASLTLRHAPFSRLTKIYEQTDQTQTEVLKLEPILLVSDTDKVVDPGEELFLATVEEAVDEALQAEVETLGSENEVETFGVVLESFTEESANVISSSEMSAEFASVSETSAEVASDVVSAILAASQEAADAAEATLSDEDIFNYSTPGFKNATVEVNRIPEILPASQIVGDPSVAPKIAAPSVGKILKFALPATGVWLCGPLLSLIDTSSVGILSGTVQQAALNPAVAVTDYAALLIAFLFTGTTNLMASALESDRGVEGSPRSTSTLKGAIQLSTYVGAGLGAVLFVFARPLLQALIGNDAMSPAVFAAAMKYVRIRALGMPAAAVIGSTQAACLGMQDIRSPLYVLLAAAVVNFIGDMLFVGSTNPWLGGAAGAAWATVFSQFAAVGLFVHWLCHKPQTKERKQVVNVSRAILELTGKSDSAGENRRRRFIDTLQSFRANLSEEKSIAVPSRTGHATTKTRRSKWTKKNKPSSKEKSFSVRGFLENKIQRRELVRLPSKSIIKEFYPYMLPVTSTQVGRVSGYVAMAHVVASSLGTVSMAAQQVIVSLFYCLCPIADSLSLTAQSFVPAIAEKKVSKERTNALRKTTRNFFKAGSIFGSVMVSAVLCIPFLSQFFTADPVVSSMVASIAPLLVGVFAVHGIVCASEGLLLGQKDLGFLGKMYAGFFAVVPFFMLRVKRAAARGVPGTNLSSVWKVFLGYQLFRWMMWMSRVVTIQRRTERESAGFM